MPAQSIPELRAEHFAGIANVLGEKITMHPLRPFYGPRRVSDSNTIKFRCKVWENRANDATGWEEPTPLGDGYDVREHTVEPVPYRNGRRLTNEEVAFFRKWSELKEQSRVTPSLNRERAEKLTEITREAMLPDLEAMHANMASALQGSISINIGGTTASASFGLTSLSPSASWATAGTKIVQDIYAKLDEFEENANVPATHAFFNPKIFSTYLTKNTEWTDYVKANPELSKAILGMAGSNDGGVAKPFQPRAPFPMFGITWVPVWGNYVPKGSSSTARWPVDKISFACLDAGDGQRTLEVWSAKNEYNPDGMVRFRILTKEDPIQYMAEHSDNEIPLIKLPERVQVLDVVP